MQMNLYTIQSLIGRRLVLGIDSADAVRRLQGCHGERLLITKKDISEYNGMPSILDQTDLMIVFNDDDSSILRIRCTECETVMDYVGIPLCKLCFKRASNYRRSGILKGRKLYR
jgi:hypothetical protein